MADRGVTTTNLDSARRLASLAATLAPVDLAAKLGGGWTVATVYAHLAAWDRWQVARWRDAIARGLAVPAEIPDFVSDLVNAALDDAVRAVPGDVAVAIWADAARSIDELVAGLPDDSIDAALARTPELVDRAPHRLEHLAQIENGLRGR